MFGSKFWEEIFGEQILLNEKKKRLGGGGKMWNNFFFKQIFLRGKFGDQVLEERFLRGGNFARKNILEEFFYVKFYCEKKYGKNIWQQILGRKSWGANSFG